MGFRGMGLKVGVNDSFVCVFEFKKVLPLILNRKLSLQYLMSNVAQKSQDYVMRSPYVKRKYLRLYPVAKKCFFFFIFQ